MTAAQRVRQRLVERTVGSPRKLLGRLKRRFSPKGLILMYHRIAEVSSDPWGLCVSPRHFAEHLEVLTNHGSILRLQQMVEALEDGNLPRRAIAVTFDDGYADVLHNAKPLLDHFRIPATLFVTTGEDRQKRGFWWDELDSLLLQTDRLPETLRLEINGQTYTWALGHTTHSKEEDGPHYRSWKAWKEAPTARHRLYRTLWQLLSKLPENERETVLDQLTAWAGVTPAEQPSQALLSTEEIATVARGGLVEIGAHTVTHPLLSSLSVSSQREEIQRSKTSLEQMVSRPVVSFAFPYGNYVAETVSIICDAGFRCACSTAGDIVREDSSRFQLPRVQVLDWEGDVFASQLSKWFSGDKATGRS